jgi:hypothetical protein
MNIFALIATLSLNCFATKPNQTKVPLAPAVTIALNEYSPLSPVNLKAVKGHLPRLGEVPLAAHALPRVVPPAKHSPFSEKLRRAKIKRTLNERPVKLDAKYIIILVSPDD